MTTMMFTIEGLKKAITARMRKNVGKHSMISTNRIRTASTRRP
jgi:hypothetical protein